MTSDRTGDVRPMCGADEPSRSFDELEAVRGRLEAAERRIARLVRAGARGRREIRRLAEMATTDVLTQLGNRRLFEAVLGECFAHSTRHGSPLSVIMVDVDSFKVYNDTFGHTAGDRALCILARQLVESSRPADVVTRYGGEEFAIVLPDADAITAVRQAERQRVAIESFAWSLGPVTASFGVATQSRSLMDLALLVDEADLALYASKRGGRNRVTHWRWIGGGAPATPGHPGPSLYRPRLSRTDRRRISLGDR